MHDPHDDTDLHGPGSVACARCKVVVDLTQPLPHIGWQVVHVCPARIIEALALTAGSAAWAWQARETFTGS